MDYRFCRFRAFLCADVTSGVSCTIGSKVEDDPAGEMTHANVAR
jgi:hypothetical protein